MKISVCHHLVQILLIQGIFVKIGIDKFIVTDNSVGADNLLSEEGRLRSLNMKHVLVNN